MSKKILHFLPRVLAILITLFFGAFILEGFSSGFSWEDSLFHSVPTIIVLLATIFAWKSPKTGGFVFIGLGVLFGLFFRPVWFIGGVSFLTGILFLIEGFKS